MIDITTFPAPRGLSDLLWFERIGVFGATSSASEVQDLLSDHGKSVDACFDNDTTKHGTTFFGLEVKPGAAAVEFTRAGGAIVIVAAYQVEIASQLRDLGVDSDHLFPFVSRMFSSHFGRAAIEPHLALIEALDSRLGDEESRTYLRDLVRFRWGMDPLDLRRNPNLKGMYLYDHPGLGPKPGAHIVDCGAFTGDTAQLFLSRLDGQAKVTAIEPLARNFVAMTRWVEENGLASHVTTVKAAVGSSTGYVNIHSGEDSADPRAFVGSGSERVKEETLDHLFANQLDSVDFLKIDIEGFEIEALRGGRDLLRRSAPDLAIAGYHKSEHLWEIPAALDELRPGYTIFLGHHPSAAYECEFFCTARPARLP